MPPIASKYPFGVISSSWESKVWKEKKPLWKLWV
jgi:hypothetical protein